MFRIVIGMSDDAKSIYDKIGNVIGEIDDHLVKLALFPNSDSKMHWRAEVYSNLHKVPKLRSTKKFPKYKFIRERLSIYEDMVDEMCLAVKREYKNLTPRNISSQEVLKLVSAYHDWLAEKLSDNGIVIGDDVFEELDELGL